VETGFAVSHRKQTTAPLPDRNKFAVHIPRESAASRLLLRVFPESHTRTFETLFNPIDGKGRFCYGLGTAAGANLEEANGPHIEQSWKKP
jgi:hypothetical protein